MKMLNKICLFHLAVAGFLVMLFTSNALSVTSEVSPAHIPVGSLYHGTGVVVTGEVEEGEDIIIKFSSPAKKSHLRQKGKAGGLLWMNVGELEFDPVSDVYLMYSTRDINSILSVEQQDKYALGYDAFRRLIEVSPVSDESEKEKWVKEFIHFQEDKKVYGISTGKIETAPKGSKKTFKLSIDWPYQAQPQDYTVIVYAVKDKSVQDHNQSSLKVETVGALSYISSMAFNNESIYGIASILIAIAAGIIVGVIFKGGDGPH